MFRLSVGFAALSFVGSVAALSGVETLYPPILNSTDYITNATLGTYGGTYVADTHGPTAPTVYGSYDYCSMPHPRKQEYKLPAAASSSQGAKLVFLEYMQRHQRRTPYNILPGGENQRYDCDNVRPYLFGGPMSDGGLQPVPVYAQTYRDPTDPFTPNVNGTCQYPQITIGGVEDGYQHGADLYGVYGEMLGLIPAEPNDRVFLRSSQSALTQASGGTVARGLWPSYGGALPLHQMVSSVDTVNSGYSCSRRSTVLNTIKSTDAWKAHMTATAELRSALGSLLGATSSDWQSTFDHFSDNFQGRLCNGYKLPCSMTDGSRCVTEAQAEMVFRAGDWEWNYYYRNNAYTTEYIQLVAGLHIGETVAHLKAVLAGNATIDYAHTFMHDNDMGPFLGALGIRAMRWPAMASNIAIEVWETAANQGSSRECKKLYARVLYSGQPIETIHGTLDWLPLAQLISILTPYVPTNIVSQCSS